MIKLLNKLLQFIVENINLFLEVLGFGNIQDLTKFFVSWFRKILVKFNLVSNPL